MTYRLLAAPIGSLAVMADMGVTSLEPGDPLMAAGAEHRERGYRWRGSRWWFFSLLVFVSLLNIFHVFNHFSWWDIAVLARLRRVVFPWLPAVRHRSLP